MSEDLFRIGVITEPHGIKGEVKVFCTSDDPMHLKKVKEIYKIAPNGTKELIHLKSLKLSGKYMILGFQEYEDRNAVETLRKHELYVARKDASPLGKDEYYISDLIGLKAIDEEGTVVGEITDVLQTGANDVYEIKRTDGTELLLPAIKQCVLNVDLTAGTITVFVLEGL